MYHYNPWTDTTDGACSSFSLFQHNPVGFFTSRFAGMTQPVAEFLANKVFCILPDPMDDSPRVSAKEFGLWIRDLPDLLSPVPRPGHHSRAASFSVPVNLTEVPGYSLASVPHSRRPSLRSAAGSRTPSLLPPQQRTSWATASISRQPSLGAFEEVEQEVLPSGLAPVHDHEIEEEADLEEEMQNDEPNSRSASTQKRRRRGRKGKGAVPTSAPVVPLVDDSIANLAQALARELSKTAKRVPAANVSSPLATSTVYNSSDAQTQQPLPPSLPPVPTPVAAPAPTITKKPSKWKLGFGKSSSNNGSSAAPSLGGVKEDQSTASKATNLIMGLNAPSTSSQSKAPAHASTHPYGHGHAGPSAPSASSTSFASHATTRHGPASATSSVVSLDDPAWQRGRRHRGAAGAGAMADRDIGMWGASTVSAFANSGHGPASNGLSSHSSHPYHSSLARQQQQARGISPASTSNVSVISASTASTNWRSSSISSSSAATSTSAFTRYSNGSVRSVSTAATSVSNTSWRSAGGKSVASNGSRASGRDPRLPLNVKSEHPCPLCGSRELNSCCTVVDGEPWELSELPRQMYPDPDNVKFSAPPRRKPGQKPKSSNLDTISERPGPYGHQQFSPSHPAPVPSARIDASTSTTDLARSGSVDGDSEESSTSPRKVQKAQINTLAKLLSTLRR